jgi:hypothetical protein
MWGVGYELVSAPFLDLPNLAFRRARSVGEQTKIEKKAARQAIFSRRAEKPDAAQPLHHRTVGSQTQIVRSAPHRNRQNLALSSPTKSSLVFPNLCLIPTM